jgi:DNA-binding NtrC family response regulator
MPDIKILIVDDEANMRVTLRANLERKGYKVLEAEDGVEALDVLQRNDVPLVITDLKMPKMDGISLLLTMYEKYPHVKSIMISAHGTLKDAVQATKLGAFDYLAKPFDFTELETTIKRALSREESDEEPRFATNNAANLVPIIGQSLKMKEVADLIKQVAAADSSVLITGETGTGKELAAKSIHNSSKRAEQPFVAVNCSALSPTLLESELFGHEKGAFTGAVQSHIGRFELADKGTLFLDEVGEMPVDLQVKLLRVIQEKTFERVGGTAPIRSDFRLIVATNRNLEEEVKTGRFREDLFYRLSVIPVVLPPLRDRKDDIPLLVDYFFKLFTEKTGTGAKTFSSAAMKRLLGYEWPGNIRELENTVERCMVLTVGREIPEEKLPLNILRGAGKALDRAEASAPDLIDTVRGQQAELERELIRNALKDEGNNRSLAARRIGWSRKTLYNKMKVLGIE